MRRLRCLRHSARGNDIGKGNVMFNSSRTDKLLELEIRYPLVESVFISRGVMHCEKCKEQIHLRGAETYVGGEEELEFYCFNCKETIYLPPDAFGRIRVAA